MGNLENSSTCSCTGIMLYEVTVINFRPGFSDNDKSSDYGMRCLFNICCYWDVYTGTRWPSPLWWRKKEHLYEGVWTRKPVVSSFLVGFLLTVKTGHSISTPFYLQLWNYSCFSTCLMSLGRCRLSNYCCNISC